MTPVGKMVLNRNPDNFFAETEQVAFCAAHIVPGLDFTNDPLLAGRIHSYVDTQISRLGGPNFHEIPINAPVAEVHNNQRDGMHRQAIHRGRVAYEPNSLGGGCPFQAGDAGLHLVPAAGPRRQGARQAGALRRPLHAGHAVLEQPDAGREGAHRPRLPLRADQGAGDRRCASASSRCSPTSPTSWRRRGAGPGHGGARRRCPRRSKKPPSPRWRRRRRSRSSRGPATAASARAGSRSWSPTASRARARARSMRGSRRRARCRASSAPVSVESKRADGKPIDVEVTLEAAPSVLFDAVVVPDGRGGGRDARASGPCAGVHQGPVPALQADPRARRGASFIEKAGVPSDAPSGEPTPACCCFRVTAREAFRSSSRRSPSIGTSRGRSIRRGFSRQSGRPPPERPLSDRRQTCRDTGGACPARPPSGPPRQSRCR